MAKSRTLRNLMRRQCQRLAGQFLLVETREKTANLLFENGSKQSAAAAESDEIVRIARVNANENGIPAACPAKCRYGSRDRGELRGCLRVVCFCHSAELFGAECSRCNLADFFDRLEVETTLCPQWVANKLHCWPRRSDDRPHNVHQRFRSQRPSPL